MKVSHHVLVLALVSLCPARDVRAQSGRPVSLQASALYVGLNGDAYSGIRGGVGAEAQVRYNVPGSWSLGAGLQYSHHSVSSLRFEPLSLVGVFAEPRLVIRVSSPKVAPYVSARLAFLRQSTAVGSVDVSATGTQVNAGGGLLLVLNQATNLDAGLTIGAVNFGDYDVTGSTVRQDAGSGTNVVFRVGLSFGVGK